MKSIMISVQPKWVEKILNGEKILEIRKSMPKCELPCKVYIYCTKYPKKLLTIFRKGDLIWSDDKEEQRFDETIFVKDDWFSVADGKHKLHGKVVAEFTLNNVEQFSVGSLRSDDIERLACLSYKEMIDYFYKPEELDGNHSKIGYGWHIEDLIVYDRPKALIEFRKPCVSPEMPYCPDCRVGYESVPESEAEFYRAGESCRTEWCCLNFIKRPPQSWCYVQEKEE